MNGWGAQYGWGEQPVSGERPWYYSASFVELTNRDPETSNAFMKSFPFCTEIHQLRNALADVYQIAERTEEPPIAVVKALSAINRFSPGDWQSWISRLSHMQPDKAKTIIKGFAYFYDSKVLEV
jgi:hypothetical protein